LQQEKERKKKKFLKKKGGEQKQEMLRVKRCFAQKSGIEPRKQKPCAAKGAFMALFHVKQKVCGKNILFHVKQSGRAEIHCST
jgi:hypothetical protein